jgi:hypothetical protein
VFLCRGAFNEPTKLAPNYGVVFKKKHLPPWNGNTRREINKFTPVPEFHKGVIRNFQMTCVFRLKMRADAVFLK